MNTKYKIILTAAAISSLLFYSCEKNRLNENVAAKYIDTTTSAQVRLIHAYASNLPNTATTVTITTAPPTFNFFANGERLNGAASQVGYAGAFPGAVGTGTGTAFDYSILQPGSVRFAAVLNRTTGATPADTVFAETFSIAAGKKYTAIAADTFPVQKFYVFNDNWTVPDTGSFQIRFINMAPNITIQGFDVYSRRKAGFLAQNVTYRSATSFVENIITTTDTLELRTAGSSSVIGQFNGFAPVRRRVYTFVIRGRSDLPTTNARYLAMSGYLNR